MPRGGWREGTCDRMAPQAAEGSSEHKLGDVWGDHPSLLDALKKWGKAGTPIPALVC